MNAAVLQSSARLGHLAEGIDLSKDVGEATFKKLNAVFNANGVMVFRSQQIAHEEHIRFSRHFGELEIHVVTQYLLAGYPEIFKISNLMKNGWRAALGAGTRINSAKNSLSFRPLLQKYPSCPRNWNNSIDWCTIPPSLSPKRSCLQPRPYLRFFVASEARRK